MVSFRSICLGKNSERLLRVKFGSVKSSGDFFRIEAVKHGQSLKDFQIELEAAVLSGARDFPHEIGDVTLTVKRLFLKGLP